MSCCIVLPYLVLCASCCAILCYNVLCLREMLISCLSHAYGAFLNSTAMCQRIRILPSCVFIVLVRLGVLLMFMVPYHQKGHFKGNRDVSLCLPTQTIFLQINVSYLLLSRKPLLRTSNNSKRWHKALGSVVFPSYQPLLASMFWGGYAYSVLAFSNCGPVGTTFFAAYLFWHGMA